MSLLKRSIQSLLRAGGYEIRRRQPKTPDSHRISRQLLRCRIGTILDVGANAGQFAACVRNAGFVGKIISFEPLSSAFCLLEAAAEGDPNWHVHNVALGAQSGTAVINISRNSVSSSFLEVAPRTLEVEPAVEYVGQETAKVMTLDGVYRELVDASERVLLKIDAQGSERHILAGAENSLCHLTALQTEMSLVPVYEGEMLCHEIVAYLVDRGFRLVDLERVFSDRETGDTLQIDGLFVNEAKVDI